MAMQSFNPRLQTWTEGTLRSILFFPKQNNMSQHLNLAWWDLPQCKHWTNDLSILSMKIICCQLWPNCSFKIYYCVDENKIKYRRFIVVTQYNIREKRDTRESTKIEKFIVLELLPGCSYGQIFEHDKWKK